MSSKARAAAAAEAAAQAAPPAAAPQQPPLQQPTAATHQPPDTLKQRIHRQLQPGGGIPLSDAEGRVVQTAVSRSGRVRKVVTIESK